MIGWIACDLDGTLLDGAGRLPEANRLAVAAARARGLRFILCSARPPRSLRPFHTALGLDEPVIAYGGALTWDFAAKRPLSQCAMPPATAAAAIRALRVAVPEAVLTAEATDLWWTDRLDPDWWGAVAAVVRQPPVAEGPLERVIAGLALHKLILFVPDPRAWAAVAAALPPGVRALRGARGLCEVQAAGATKALAMARLAAAPTVLAIGDGPGDADLLAWAGDSAAPAGADPAALAAARRTVRSCDAGAVADALRPLLGATDQPRRPRAAGGPGAGPTVTGRPAPGR